jgi:hypothetical protein
LVSSELACMKTAMTMFGMSSTHGLRNVSTKSCGGVRLGATA